MRLSLTLFLLAASPSYSTTISHTCSVDDFGQPSPNPLLYGSLRWLTYPLSTGNFLDTYYQQAPIFFQRRNHTHYQPAISWRDINFGVGMRSPTTKKYMSARATRTGQDVAPFHYWKMPEVLAAFPKAEIKKGQKTAKNQAYWDPAALEYLYDEGYSLQYPAVELYWKKPLLFYELTKHLGVYSRLNIYVTPKKQQGFKAHFDSHDVYVLQMSGSKHWKVYGVPEGASFPFPVTDWGDDKLDVVRSKLGKPLIDVILEEGDGLYIPRGHMHEAKCDTDEPSSHVTVGFMTMKVSDLIYISVRESKHMDATTLKKFKNYLQTRTKESADLRRSALLFCLASDTRCKTPTDRLIKEYTAATEGFILSQQSNNSILRLLRENGISILELGMKYRTKELNRLARRSKASRLAKIRPITHELQEKRKPREWIPQ